MEKTVKKHRDLYWQFIRGICILAVILVHSLSINKEYNINIINISIRQILNFAVPVFVFMSGYFINIEKFKSKEEILYFYAKRSKKLILPFFIFSCIYCIIYIITTNDEIIWSELIKGLFIGKYGEQLYYIVVLLELVIITPLLVKLYLANSSLINILILSITPICYFINDIYFKINGYAINNLQIFFIAWISYFYLGIIIRNKKNKLNNQLRRNSKIIIYTTITILAIIMSIFIFNQNYANYNFCISQMRLTNICYVLVILYLIINNHKKGYNKSNKVINKIIEIGNVSFGIYFIHLIPLKIIKKIVNIIKINYFIQILIIFIGTLLFTLLIIKIIKRIFNKKYYFLFGL